MERCPKCNSINVLYLKTIDAGKCKDCEHWWGETMCIIMDVEYAFKKMFNLNAG